MKTVTITKTYNHSRRRTWQPGDNPTVSNELADNIVKRGFGYITAEGDTRRDNEEEDEEEEETAFRKMLNSAKKKKQPTASSVGKE